MSFAQPEGDRAPVSPPSAIPGLGGAKGDGAQPEQAGPTLSLPKGGGAIQGIGEKFQVSPATGTGSLSVPIAISPGRGGFGPQLSLSYDSGAGNGPCGLGWGIGRPSVSRKTQKGLSRYEDAEESDVFVLSGAEDLVPVLNEGPDGQWQRETVDDEAYTTRGGERFDVHRYRPRVEGLFARIEHWVRRSDGDTHWRAITADNRTTVYGENAEARIIHPDDPSRVFEWLIERSYDDKGNIVVYRYQQEDTRGIDAGRASERHRLRDRSAFAQTYLKRVLYGNTRPYLVHHNNPGGPGFDERAWEGGNEWHFQLVLDYGDHPGDEPRPDPGPPWPVRQDPFSSYRAGFELRTYRLCRRFLMYHRFPELGRDWYLVRSTVLRYDGERDDPGNPVATRLVEVAHWAHERGRQPAPSPGVRFSYSLPEVDDELLEIAPEELADPPDGRLSSWIDLERNGLTGVLAQHDGAWYYRENLGHGRFSGQRPLGSIPALAAVGHAEQQLTDLDGDGQLNLVSFAPSAPGHHELGNEGWEPYRALAGVPNLDWADPNLRLIDLTGDGHPDVLITEDDRLRWYPALGDDGYGPAVVVAKASDEERGPAVVFADQSIHLADMSGDGLTDIVRIRNGEVCYWPNTGYGSFAAKVTMDDAPVFDRPDSFDPRRFRLGDIDGTGTADLIYLDAEGVRYWHSQAGNGFGEEHRIAAFPRIDNLTSVQVLDLLGAGTACIVWASPLPGDASRPLRYVPLMSEGKPYLLTEVDNGLGAMTRLGYVPSTQFYLADRLAGQPWVTKLPFPVHVVERVESYDAIARNRFVTHYAYHHGYFDGEEREFRGFGMVEQWDTEHYDEFGQAGLFPPADNRPQEPSHVPPVLTRTWFHNGFFADRERISRHYEHEYYRGDPEAWLLPDTQLPEGLSAEEQREACRALKGRPLRQEVYGLDGPEHPHEHPYTVSETAYHIRLEQPREGQRHAVFYACECETLSYHYERNPADPRISHSHTLEVDRYGNVLRSAAIAYPRRPVPDRLPEQEQMLITVTEQDLIHLDDDPFTYRTGLPFEQRGYELQGLEFAGLWEKEELAAVIRDTEPEPAPGEQAQRRLLQRSRARYYADTLDPEMPLPFGEANPLAIPHNSYQLAFTAETVAQPELGGRITPELLLAGGYLNDVDEDPTHWWVPSGVQLFDRERAAEMFYLPTAARDPFGAETQIAYDEPHYLFPVTVTDPLGNTTAAVHDYRVLQPRELTDPNGNRSAAVFDTAGMVIATAVMGKERETDPEAIGDSVEAYVRIEPGVDGDGIPHDITADVLSDPHRFLQDATSHFHYDPFAWRRDHSPPVAVSVSRETHAAQTDGVPTAVQLSVGYSDGLGRAILTKAQAEDGDAPQYGPEGQLVIGPDGKPEMAHSTDRWVGNGATVMNNKGLAVQQYEPFFDSGPGYTDEDALRRIGVTPTLHYDPLGRVVRTDQPDGAVSRVEFDPWQQTSHDPNDTVRDSDSDWYAQMTGPSASQAQRRAATAASEHRGTPSRVYLDVLGRPFVSLAHNRRRYWRGTELIRVEDEFIPTRTELDIEGNPRTIWDGRRCEGLTLEQAIAHRGNTVMTYTYAMGGLQLHHNSMDAGERWALSNVAGNPIAGWDARGHQIETEYDELQRPIRIWVDSAETGERFLAERIVYGEALDAEDPGRAAALNLRGRPHLHLDGAGLATSARFDFKGNPLNAERRLAREFDRTPDWTPLAEAGASAVAASDLLEAEPFPTRTRYDALNRPIALTTPDQSVQLPAYNKAGLLESISARLHDPNARPTHFITAIDYNARGQRTQIDYANGATTTYAYDERTFRLTGLHTTRARNGRTENLQDLHYTYDPVGNVSEIRDDAIEPLFFQNQLVSAENRYTYDPLYRLIDATGRESAASPGIPSHNPPALVGQRMPVHGIPGYDRALRNYTQYYDYEPGGNMLQLRHAAGTGGFTRDYQYASDSNRLLGHTLPESTAATYEHDPHGNLRSMPHLRTMAWDHKDQLQHVSLSEGQQVSFTYDGAGQRARKVWIHGGIRHEGIYLGAYEIARRYTTGVDDPEAELQTLHVMDGTERTCLVETPTVDDGNPVRRPNPRCRYQLANHLSSATVELDERAGVLTWEEYHPYGSTAYHATNGRLEVSAKRYRYTGMERDEETGLNSHGARYYAPWLARWCSTDPIGPDGGINLFVYAGNHPVDYVDPSGTQHYDPLTHTSGGENPVTPEPGVDIVAGSSTPTESLYFEDHPVHGRLAPPGERQSAGPAGAREVLQGVLPEVGVDAESFISKLPPSTVRRMRRPLPEVTPDILTYPPGSGEAGEAILRHQDARVGQEVTERAEDAHYEIQQAVELINAAQSLAGLVALPSSRISLPTRGFRPGARLSPPRTAASTRSMPRTPNGPGTASQGSSTSSSATSPGRVVFSGHGTYRAGSGRVSVPEGTTLTIYERYGYRITDRLGGQIELDIVPPGRFSRTYGPGARIPNLTLHPPDNLIVFEELGSTSVSVRTATRLEDLLTPNMGNCHWAACLEFMPSYEVLPLP